MSGLKTIDGQECNFMVLAVKKCEIRTITEIKGPRVKILFVQTDRYCGWHHESHFRKLQDKFRKENYQNEDGLQRHLMVRCHSGYLLNKSSQVSD